MRWAVSIAILFCWISSAVLAQDSPLAIFDGVWISIDPPGYQIVFNKVAGGLRQANLPVLGAATITISDGRDASNLKVSGLGFDCYYLFAPTTSNGVEIIWKLQSGPAACPPSASFKKVQASVEGSNLMTKYFGASLGDRRANRNGLARTTIDLTPYGLKNVGIYDMSVITLAEAKDYTGVSLKVALYSRLGSDNITLIIATTHYGWNWGDNDQYLYSSFSQILQTIGIKGPPQLTATTTPFSAYPTGSTSDGRTRLRCGATKFVQSPVYEDRFISAKYFMRNDVDTYVVVDANNNSCPFRSFQAIKESRGRSENTDIQIYLTSEK